MRKKIIFILFLAVFTVCSGCENKQNSENKHNTQEQIIQEESENLAEGYRNLYEKAVKEDTLETLELQQKIIGYFGNIGYAAVDSDNQIDMVNSGQVEEFCKKAGRGEKGKLRLFSVMNAGGFVRYDMETEDGNIDVIVSSLKWIDNRPTSDYYHEFKAYAWKYTEKGYFFIEEYHPPGFDGASGQKGFRVKPLDKSCRELNRKYVIPMGYEWNNMLIVDWNEQDYSRLDFYDLYEQMHRLKYGTDVSYQSEYAGTEYEIPKAEFEEVIQTYMKISSEDIQKNTVYYPERNTYRYRSRGRYGYEYPYEPYPEVVSYEQQDDGTLKLLVDAVWIKKESDQALSSELVIRPLANGRYQYVSNKVVYSDENVSSEWYMPRLSDGEWEKYYKKYNQTEETASGIYEKGYDLPVDESILDDGIKNIPDYQYRIQERHWRS